MGATEAIKTVLCKFVKRQRGCGSNQILEDRTVTAVCDPKKGNFWKPVRKSAGNNFDSVIFDL